MVFAKGDPGIAGLYDELLVAEELKPFGKQLRDKYVETQQLLLQVQKPATHCTALHFTSLYE
jgi:phosphoenolpyruvate carboxylase